MVSIVTTFFRALEQQVTREPTDTLKREQRQSVLRLAVTAILTSYLWIYHARSGVSQNSSLWLGSLALFFLFATGVAVAAFRAQRSHGLRRALANIGDIAIVTFLLCN